MNGRAVTTEYQRKALLGDRDITSELRKQGLSDREIFFEMFLDADGVDYEALENRLGEIKRKVGYLWGISGTVFWNMTFPAREETIVEHEYAPATGYGWAIPDLGTREKPSKVNMDAFWKSFTGKTDRENEDCLDERTKRAIASRVRTFLSNGADGVTPSYRKVEYILGTGRNWKGPIGEFTLRLVKENTGQFVSVCFPGQPRRISPTVYEFSQKDFVPQDLLVVYFYDVKP